MFKEFSYILSIFVICKRGTVSLVKKTILIEGETHDDISALTNYL